MNVPELIYGCMGGAVCKEAEVTHEQADAVALADRWESINDVSMLRVES